LEATEANAEDFEPERVLKKYPSILECKVLEMDTRLSVLFASAEKTGPHQSRELIQSFLSDQENRDISIFIVVDEDTDPGDISTTMWKVLNNIDPRRDLYLIEGRLGIDASKKFPEEGHVQGWPEEIKMSPEMVQQVDEKWKHLF